MVKKILITAVCSGIINAQMISVTEQIAVTKPYTTKVKVGQRCYEDTVEELVPCDNQQDTNSLGVDTLIGAVIGVAVGNQIGRGNGRAVAKVVGGLGGAYAANQSRNSNMCKTYRKVTKCKPKYDYVTKNITVGYKNCAMFKGQRVCKETKEPLEYLNVTQRIYVH